MSSSLDVAESGLVSLWPAKNETLLLGNHAAWLHCADGILESAVGEALLKAGKRFTTRNWATVEKIRALMQSAG